MSTPRHKPKIEPKAEVPALQDPASRLSSLAFVTPKKVKPSRDRLSLAEEKKKELEELQKELEDINPQAIKRKYEEELQLEEKEEEIGNDQEEEKEPESTPSIAVKRKREEEEVQPEEDEEKEEKKCESQPITQEMDDQPEPPKKRNKKKRSAGKLKDGGWGKKTERKKSKAQDPDDAKGRTFMLKAYRKVKESKGKTSFLFNSKLIKHLSPWRANRVKTDVHRFARGHKTFSPIATVEEYSADQLPKICRTKSGTRVFARSYNGMGMCFSESPPSHPVRSERKKLSPTHIKKIKDATIYDLIVKAGYELEGFKKVINAELVEEARKKIKQNDGKRSHTQSWAVAKDKSKAKEISADKYGKLFQEDLAYEWLHFIMYQLLGPKAQKPENMGCGSFDANTHMLHVEFCHPSLVKAYPKGYTVSVKPHYNAEEELKGNKYLERLEYTIKTDDFELPFIFDCRTKIRPDLSEHVYMRGLVLAALNIPKPKDETALEEVDPNVLYTFSPTLFPTPEKKSAPDPAPPAAPADPSKLSSLLSPAITARRK